MIIWINERGRTMATERASDLRAFKGFIEEKLSNGGSDLTLDEALVHATERLVSPGRRKSQNEGPILRGSTTVSTWGGF
jgi:hypothetical protein